MASLPTIAKRDRKNKLGIADEIIYRWSAKSMTGVALKEKELIPLLEAARWAPSSNNNQEWRYHYALRNSQAFKDLFGLLTPGNQTWCDKAGALLVLVSQKISDYKDKPIRTHAFDTGSSFEAFAVEGLKRNLVVHPMGGFDLENTTAYLKLDTNRFEIQCMIAVGKPSAKVKKEEVSGRKEISEFVNKLE